MNISAKAAAIMSAALLSGCASLDISSPGSLSGVRIVGTPGCADRQVVVENSAFHVFWTWTVATGDLRWNDEKKDIEGGTAFFADYCGNDDCYEVLKKVAERENCDLANVIFTESSTSDFNFSSYMGLFGFFAGRYGVEACAILRPKKGVK